MLESKTPPQDLEAFCKENGFVKWFLTSARDDIGMNEAGNFVVQTILDNDDGFAKQYAKQQDIKGIKILDSNVPRAKPSACCSQ